MLRRMLFSLAVLFILLPVNSLPIFQKSQKLEPFSSREFKSLASQSSTEYWAVLIGVGKYANHPDEDRPSMLQAVNDFYELLLESEYWEESHIKILKAEECTAVNIINALRWLDEMDDENDISLIYIATHGIQGPDIPPFDERDGKDEYLVTYWGFEYPITCIWDDELNFFLSRLDSQGIAVIIDSCHSGGIGDCSSLNWNEEFLNNIKGEGRVILMSCAENELSYGSYFSKYIIEGLQGYADLNADAQCSAEEAFEYAEPKILELAEEWDVEWHPQIYDSYDGELILTEAKITDRIDQQQTQEDGWGYDIHYNQWLAQSFIPSLSYLTRIRLKLFTTTDAKTEIEVSIKESLTGDDLVAMQRQMKGEGDEEWIEFDFDDISVTPGKTYYIICKTQDKGTSHSYCYCWYFAWKEEGRRGPYQYGKAYFSTNQGENWNAIPDDDFCFITYGR